MAAARSEPEVQENNGDSVIAFLCPTFCVCVCVHARARVCVCVCARVCVYVCMLFMFFIDMETAVRLEEDPPGDTVSSYINANYLQVSNSASIVTLYPIAWHLLPGCSNWQSCTQVYSQANPCPGLDP